MTLLFQCGGSYVSGLEIVELALMSGLAARGHRVHALVSGWTDGDFPARLDAAGIPHTTAFTGKLSLARPNWMLDTLRHLPGARRTVRRLMRDLAPDAVVGCNRDAVLLLAGVFGRTPVLFHVHETMSPEWTRRVGRVVDRFVAVSEFVASTIAAAGVAPGRVAMVHNGVALAAPVAAAGNPPVVGICGQIGHWKGHDDLVDALALVARRGVEFRLHVYGRGDDVYVEALKDRVNVAKLAASTEWHGFELDHDRMYGALDMLAVPSRVEETFGMTLIEAGIRGLPAVATRVGGIHEVVRNGETGLLVPPAQPPALADALALLLGEVSRRRAMGVAAREYVGQTFLMEQMVGRFEAILCGQ